MSFHFKTLVGLAVAAVSLAACGDEQVTNVSSSLNRNVVIVDQTGATIWEFYGSRISTNSWEEDILGSTILSNCESVNIDFDDGTDSCVFDMRAVFRDVSAIVQNGVDVYRVTSVTFR